MKSFIKQKLREELSEVIEIPVEVGDTVLMGKFKNKKVVVKDIEWDEEKGDLKINGKPALKMRIPKKQVVKENLHNSLVYELIDTMLDEDYPSSWNIEEFKKLNSFNARIKYCEANLQRISSGSSRIVYKIDDEKVLKLAKNKKGLAQNEVEADYSQYDDISHITARVFDYDPNNLWIEMELARKLRKPEFEKITGFKWNDFSIAMYNYGIDSGNVRGGHKMALDPAITEAMWEQEFTYAMFDFMGNYGIPAGDLRRTSSYGLVKRDGQDEIVMIDYGLTSDVYDSYYS